MRKYIALGLISMTGACAVSTPENSSSSSETGEVAAVTFTDETTGETISAFETLSFEGGSKVGFFEPEPGSLFVTAWGPNGAKSAISKEVAQEDLLPLELYERLSGREAPVSLVQAQTRALDAEAASGEARGDTRVQSIATKPAASTEGGDEIRSKESEVSFFDCKGSFSYDEWFNCNFCGSVRFDYTWMWSTGNGTVYEEDVTTYWSTVSVYGGNGLSFRVRHRPWYSWSNFTNVNIIPGYYVQSVHRNTSTDYDLESKTLNATGSFYHWCTNGWG